MAAPVCVEPIGSDNSTLRVWPTKDGLRFERGCFWGDEDDFLKAVSNKHGATHHGEAYRLAVQLAKHALLARGVSIDPEPQAAAA